MIDLLCLIEFYNTYNKNDIFHEISEKLLNNYIQIENMGMQELADYLFVSTSTLYRFVKTLSYENYGQMKHGHQVFLENYMSSGRYMSKQMDTSTNFSEYGEYLCRNIRQITAGLSADRINEVVQAMLDAENIIFIGIPMPSAIWRLQVELVLLGKRTSAFLNPEYQEEAVRQAGEKDCIFMIKYLTEETAFYREIAEEAARKGIPVILVSNVPISPLLQFVKYPITFEGDLYESDMILATVILNIIGNQLNRKVLKWRNQSYLEAPISV